MITDETDETQGIDGETVLTHMANDEPVLAGAPSSDIDEKEMKKRAEARKKFMKGIRKRLDSTSFDSSKYGTITEWIDTGDYGLNRIISGDVYRGVPNGRVVVLAGESQTGKSFVAAQIAANALNKLNYDNIFYFDSEGGAMEEFFKGRGCDTSKIEHILVGSVQEAIVAILGVYNDILELKKVDPDYKALCIFDSLGACVDAKFLRDAATGKVASDMGLRAKLCNNMVKALTIPALKTGATCIIANHVYDDPNGNPSKIKNQGGGKGTAYMARLTIQCARAFEKEGDTAKGTYYKATVLKFITVKNATVKPFFMSDMYLDFSRGTNPYFGLLKPAMRMGYIKNPTKGYYQVPSWQGDKKLRLREIIDNPEAWNTFLDEFNERSKKELAYSGSGQDIAEGDLDDIVSEDDDDMAKVNEMVEKKLAEDDDVLTDEATEAAADSASEEVSYEE